MIAGSTDGPYILHILLGEADGQPGRENGGIRALILVTLLVTAAPTKVLARDVLAASRPAEGAMLMKAAATVPLTFEGCPHHLADAIAGCAAGVALPVPPAPAPAHW